MLTRKTILSLFAPLLLLIGVTHGQNFQVSDIQVEGLEQLEPGVVFTAMGIDPEARVLQGNTQALIQKLYATELFEDVKIGRRGNHLLITVKEHPIIDEILLVGNKDLKDKQIKDVLADMGLSPGKSYNPAKVHLMKTQMRNVYETRGKYNVKIDSEIRELPRNRVRVIFNISEGKTAKIKAIDFTGNESITDRALKRQINTKLSGLSTILSGKDKYNAETIQEDLTKLDEFYHNKGYLDVNVAHSFATLTQDRENIQVDFFIDEGEIYYFDTFEVVGNTMVPKEELMALIEIKPGSRYNKSDVDEAVEAISVRLGNEGYALARVNAIPTKDEENRTVSFSFAVDAGDRSYVRRINIVGNSRTQDEVFRREMRQMEGALFATSDVERSKVRIQRLAHVEDVEVATEQVSPDEVDLTYSVKERSAGTLQFGVSYGQDSKFGVMGGFNQANFMGTGHDLSINAETDRSGQTFAIGYTNPYFTTDGLSLGVEFQYSKRKHDWDDTGDYIIDGYALMLNAGYPFTEYTTFNGSVGYERMGISTTPDSPWEIYDELGRPCSVTLPASGYCPSGTNRFKTHKDLYRFSLGIDRDTRDRTIFATTGTYNYGGISGTLPGSDDRFYKLHFNHKSYFTPFGGSDDYVVALSADVGAGYGYGSTKNLPFYENFYAGGIGTVRGYRQSSLGPKYQNNDSRGGALRVNGTAEIVMKVPGIDSNNVRWSAFIDAGQVFKKPGDYDLGDLRYSAGISFSWLSPIGPLNFSYATPIKDKAGDRKQRFQFTVGFPF